MSLSSLNKIILRSFLRHARSLKHENKCLWVQSFPKLQEFQTYTTAPSSAHIKTFVDQFPEPTHDFLMDNISSRTLDSSELRRICTAGFRINPLKGREDATSIVLECMKVINNQKRLHDSTSIEITQGVTVVLSVIYDNRDDGQLHHLPGFHSFYYRVGIENNANFPVRLVGRHWVFKCAEGTQEIEVPKFAPGVLGINPIILPGECFQYMSMVHLATPEGSMEGSFLLENKANNEPLEIKVGLCKMSFKVSPIS